MASRRLFIRLSFEQTADLLKVPVQNKAKGIFRHKEHTKAFHLPAIQTLIPLRGHPVVHVTFCMDLICNYFTFLHASISYESVLLKKMLYMCWQLQKRENWNEQAGIICIRILRSFWYGNKELFQFTFLECFFFLPRCESFLLKQIRVFKHLSWTTHPTCDCAGRKS